MAALMVFALAMAGPILTGAAEAQTLDMSLDAALGSGLLLGEGDDGTAVGRTPLYLEFEAGFVFDGDTQFEYVLGTTVQLETRPGVGFTPQVRVLQPFGTVRAFAAAGVPFFLFPFTRLGLELTGGALIPVVPDRFDLVGQLQLDAFFAGSDLPSGTVIMINLGLGGRLYF